jgi:hypothetical protein
MSDPRNDKCKEGSPKPSMNNPDYQGQLQQVVIAHLSAHQTQLDHLLLTAEPPLKPVDYQSHIINRQQVYIEVKTTNSSKYQPFYISANELTYSKEYENRYSLYRVNDFNKKSRIFQLSGAVNINACVFRDLNFYTFIA